MRWDIAARWKIFSEMKFPNSCLTRKTGSSYESEFNSLGNNFCLIIKNEFYVCNQLVFIIIVVLMGILITKLCSMKLYFVNVKKNIFNNMFSLYHDKFIIFVWLTISVLKT